MKISIIQSLVLGDPLYRSSKVILRFGLLVGVAGIGVVTVRNVSERRAYHVGCLRADGLPSTGHVLRLFSIEVSWVAVTWHAQRTFGDRLRVPCGSLQGAFGKPKVLNFHSLGPATLGLFLLGWVIVLAITTYVPVRQASKIPTFGCLAERVDRTNIRCNDCSKALQKCGAPLGES